MTYVYFLLLSNNDIYKGSTRELKRRLKEHDGGKVESTRYYRPVRLLGFESYAQPSDARRREKFLKTTEGRRLLRQQYRDAIQAEAEKVRDEHT
jgi:putative endonuclease